MSKSVNRNNFLWQPLQIKSKHSDCNITETETSPLADTSSHVESAVIASTPSLASLDQWSQSNGRAWCALCGGRNITVQGTMQYTSIWNKNVLEKA